MRYDVTFITAGLLCVLVGMTFGIWMGASNDFTFAPAHAHLNLVGWVSLSLYGLIHRAFPALATAKVAKAQCVIAILGAVVMPPTIIMVIANAHANPLPAILASFLVLTGALLFTIMFIGKATAAKAA